MRAVWKFQLDDVAEQWIEMPANARILTVGTQHNYPYLWAVVTPDAPLEKRRILVVGTGHPRDDFNVSAYIGTFQLYDGRLVFHVFEDLMATALEGGRDDARQEDLG